MVDKWTMALVCPTDKRRGLVICSFQLLVILLALWCPGLLISDFFSSHNSIIKREKTVALQEDNYSHLSLCMQRCRDVALKVHPALGRGELLPAVFCMPAHWAPSCRTGLIRSGNTGLMETQPLLHNIGLNLQSTFSGAVCKMFQYTVHSSINSKFLVVYNLLITAPLLLSIHKTHDYRILFLQLPRVNDHVILKYTIFQEVMDTIHTLHLCCFCFVFLLNVSTLLWHVPAGLP